MAQGIPGGVGGRGDGIIDFLKRNIMPVAAGVLLGGAIAFPVGLQQGIKDGFVLGHGPDWKAVAQGHSTGSGNQKVFGKQGTGGFEGAVQPSDDLDGEGSKKDLADKKNGHSQCAGIENNTAKIEYQFHIQKSCKLSESGNVSAKFFLFENNDPVASPQFTIHKGNSTVNSNSIEVLPTDYLPAQNDTSQCIVNFSLEVTFTVPNNYVGNVYSIVFELADGHPGTDTIPGLSPLDCSVLDATRLQFYECIKAGNTHRRDHITIETLSLCPPVRGGVAR